MRRKKEETVEGGGGLFTGTRGPRAPPVLYIPEVLAGLRSGGRRNIVVPPDIGYSDLGEGEIPPGAAFMLEVELLEIR